jgi:uncharacterized OsmC-like protein
MANSVRSRLEESRAKFRDDPMAAVSSPSATAILSEGRARITSGNFTWEADLGPAIGGGNQAASPTAYLLGALAGCAVAFLNDTLAPLHDVTLDAVSATATCRSDAAGLLGIEGTDPALADIAVTIRVVSPDPEDRVQAMLAAWRERCPIYLALIKPNTVSVTFDAAR